MADPPPNGQTSADFSANKATGVNAATASARRRSASVAATRARRRGGLVVVGGLGRDGRPAAKRPDVGGFQSEQGHGSERGDREGELAVGEFHGERGAARSG